MRVMGDLTIERYTLGETMISLFDHPGLFLVQVTDRATGRVLSSEEVDRVVDRPTMANKLTLVLRTVRHGRCDQRSRYVLHAFRGVSATEHVVVPVVRG